MVPVGGSSRAAAQRLEIEVALDRAQRLVVDDAVVAKADDGLAFGQEDRVPDGPMVEQLLLGLVVRGIAARPDMGRLVVVLVPELLDERQVVRILALQAVQPLQGRLDRGQPRVRLLGLAGSSRP